MLSNNLASKMGFAAGQRILLANPPAGMEEALQALAPSGTLEITGDQTGRFDQILWWPDAFEGLAARLSSYALKITPEGAVWLIIPKKKHAAGRGISFSWEAMQEEALKTHLVDNKVVSFSDTDYATRFVIRKIHKHEYGEDR